MKHYSMKITFDFQCMDDLEARKTIHKLLPMIEIRLAELSIPNCRYKLREVFDDKEPRSVAL